MSSIAAVGHFTTTVMHTQGSVCSFPRVIFALLSLAVRPSFQAIGQFGCGVIDRRLLGLQPQIFPAKSPCGFL